MKQEQVSGFAGTAPFRLPPPSPASGGRVRAWTLRAFPSPAKRGKVPKADGGARGSTLIKLLPNQSLQAT